MPFKARPSKGTKADGLFRSVKKENTYVTGPLDKYLTELSAKDGDRAIDVNAPSAIGSCSRSIWYSRTGVPPDSDFIDPRTRRIFDNGHHMHDRLQKYLKAASILLMDEVPVRSDGYNIQGHTDGILSLDKTTGELGVLELKSINDGNFKELRDAKHEHKQQALIYLYCIEERREAIQKKYKSFHELATSIKERTKYFESLYAHMEGGGKHTLEEKLEYKVGQHVMLDRLLFKCEIPLTKAVIVYENKNDQNMKEFVVDSTTGENSDIILLLLEQYELVNEAVETGKAPPREGKNKSDPVCRWCGFLNRCWG